MNHKITNMGGGWLIHVDKIQMLGEMCNNYVQAVKVTSLTAQAALSNGTRQIMGLWPMLTMGVFFIIYMPIIITLVDFFKSINFSQVYNCMGTSQFLWKEATANCQYSTKVSGDYFFYLFVLDFECLDHSS